MNVVWRIEKYGQRDGKMNQNYPCVIKDCGYIPKPDEDPDATGPEDKGTFLPRI